MKFTKMAGALTAGFLASACCILPLMVTIFGIGGVWGGNVTALEPYRPIFIAIALFFLAFIIFNEFFKVKKGTCECDLTTKEKFRQKFILFGTLLTLVLIFIPNVIETISPLEKPIEYSLSYTIEGMTCESCAFQIEHAVKNIKGVETVSVSYTKAKLMLQARSPEVQENIEETVQSLGYQIFRKESK